jgi:hypothetical protein
VHEAFIGRCKEILPIGTFDAASLKVAEANHKTSLASVFTTTTYGIVNSVDTGGAEKDYLPCIRMVSQGTRAVLLTSFKDIMQFMEAKGESKENSSTVAGIKTFFFGMSSETMQEYVKTAAVVHGTVDAGSYLYVPGAYRFAERTSIDTHTFGLRAAVFGPDSGFKLRVQPLIEARKAKGTTSVLIEAAVKEVEASVAATKVRPPALAAGDAKDGAADAADSK